MNNLNMAGMHAANGALGGMPLMNNGSNGGMSRADADPEGAQAHETKLKLNTYIYDYFLKNDLYECARAIIQSQVPLALHTPKSSPGRRRDGDMNGVDDSAMDTDSKDDLDSKRPDDLPLPMVPSDVPANSFLLDWFQLFWDIYFAQRKGKAATPQAVQYLQNTQVGQGELGLQSFAYANSIWYSNKRECVKIINKQCYAKYQCNQGSITTTSCAASRPMGYR